MDLDDLRRSISAALDHPGIQRSSAFLSDLMGDERAVICILVALVMGFVIGRYRVKRAYPAYTFQNRGEELVRRAALRHFGPPDYHLMNHVTLQLDDGTTQADHILVSRFGVFVIETKDYNGWIFGDVKDANWTQVHFYNRFRFQNPIRQNFRHVMAVQNLLDFLPPGTVKSVVVFTGEAEFKTAIPPGVFSLSDFMTYLRQQNVEVMSLNRLQFCVGRLETARLAISRQTDVEHVESLQKRHGSGGPRWI
jgi:hypothetical protein